MKWIKTVIGAVIAISVVPFVVLSVINIKKSLKTEEITIITIELDYYPSFIFDGYLFDHNLGYNGYNELIDYFEKGYIITNLYDYTNDITITITNVNIGENDNLIMVDNNYVGYTLNSGVFSIRSSYDSIYNAIASNIVLMDITLTRTNVNLAAILISFIPIIFVGGVVLFFYKPLKNGVWHN